MNPMSDEIVAEFEDAMTQFIVNQRQFSLEAFGKGGRVAGIIDHIQRELDEVRLADSQHSVMQEFGDVALLAIDGMQRTGIPAREIARFFYEKLKKNKARKWPEITGDESTAILHVKSIDVPSTINVVNKLIEELLHHRIPETWHSATSIYCSLVKNMFLLRNYLSASSMQPIYEVCHETIAGTQALESIVQRGMKNEDAADIIKLSLVEMCNLIRIVVHPIKEYAEQEKNKVTETFDL